MAHIPVLLQEVIRYLNPQPGEDFIDTTFGGGGHSREILKKILPGGRLLAVDWDEAAISRWQRREERGEKGKMGERGLGERGSRLDTRPPSLLKESEPLLGRSGIESGPFDSAQGKSLSRRLFLEVGNFAEIETISQKYFPDGVDGVLFDFGFSTDQLESSGRGFSYLKDEPLDMRYSTNEITAGQIINTWPERELERIFREYGEERYARKIAQAIVEARRQKKIRTTRELVEIIDPTSLKLRGASRSYRTNKTYSRVFQALRIAVNDELTNIQRGLAGAWRILKPGGRLAAISFHSLEDRIVKNFFNEKKREAGGEILTKKPITASAKEVSENPRSRSTKLRAIKKI